MPRFLTTNTDYRPIPDDTYVLKVLTAVEKVSERGNAMFSMTLGLPDGRSLPPISRVSRFLTREQASIKNPDLARITLQPQAPVSLQVVNPRDYKLELKR